MEPTRNYRGHARVAVLMVAVTVLAPMLAFAPSARAAAQIFTVNSTADSNGACNATECTLREAITAANNNAGADTIEFDIPGASVHTIAPATALPAITEAVTINGYSQPGASANTKAKDTNAKLLIELSGANAPDDSIGLEISAGPTTARGLVINRFKRSNSNGNGDAISMGNGAGNTGNVIAGNFIGTDPTGTRDRGNDGRGIECFGDCADAQIGGPNLADRNLISGNGSNGVVLFTDDHLIQGNLIGTDRSGKRRLGNFGDGVFVKGSNNSLIGNVIAFNGSSGITNNTNLAVGNLFLRNAIFKNGDLGIDLGDIGPTPNDLGSPSDADTGPNGLQNFPVITSAKPRKITGTLATTPSTGIRIEFFANPKRGKQGQTYLGFLTASTDSNGNFGFSYQLSKPVKVGMRITATASTADGTSEFSLPKKVT